MTREDINDIINAICPNDEDYEKPCISPKYLRQELEQLALDQRQWNGEPTTKNDLVTLTFSKGTLKYSCKDYVVYKKDWLRSHYGAEIDIMFGDSQYKEPTTKNDCETCIHNKGVLECDMYGCKYEPTTKNNLGVNTDKLISDCEKMSFDIEIFNKPLKVVALDAVKSIVNDMPSVTPQEPTDKIFTKAELDSMAKAINYGWELRVNEVLDKIRAEIEEIELLARYTRGDIKQMALDVINKYMAESEDNNVQTM